jgi:septal ring factor EnvC (AmiA/AmiB activator)
VSPEDPWAELAANRAQRVDQLADDLSAVQAGLGKVAETQAEQRTELAGHDDDIARLTKELERVSEQLRTNTMVLVGFAFTVAGSAIGLALALGGHG